jgi:hypothetical protein
VPAIVEALQLLDQHIDSVPPEQVSYCFARAERVAMDARMAFEAGGESAQLQAAFVSSWLR